ncbi:MAG: phosphomannomutase/phosphoglucomutase [bacterium]|nr:phosphomannomutase/phosphoglucomutase [bacterium]MDZ4285576.1 phosphomannomutase/phosphoglucomutase [Candidatus Sungbacteria bacterium]
MSIDSKIFKAYDIRGIYPAQLNEEAVYDIIQAYVSFVKPETVVLGKDVRKSGPALAKAALDALVDAGVNVIDLGTVNVDMLYVAVRNLNADGGVYLSASHNAKEWNGINLCMRGSRPISSETGLRDIQRRAEQKIRMPSIKKGKVSTHDIMDEYVKFVLSFVDIKKIRPMKIAVNGNFGISVQVFSRIVKEGNLPIKIIPLNAEPDGSFPKGDPNPLLLENRAELTKLIKKTKADLGIAWDADGDRCFFVDEKGRFVEGYFITALIAKELLKKHPGEKIIIDPRLIWATQDVIRAAGGTPIISRAGMTIIAGRMEKEKALFAGEMSSHFYFRENAYRDNGMIPVFVMLEEMGVEKKKLSQLAAPLMKKYLISGELNFHVSDAPVLFELIEKKYEKGTLEYIDGVSVAFPKWRFNVRSSNTEPLVRLNVEALSDDLLKSKTKELVKIIKGFGAK